MSNQWNGFNGLDLSGVEESKSRLGVGRYTVVCKEAKVEQQEGTNNRKVVALLEDVDGAGDIRVNFNVFHSSQQAMEIGLRQLKSFLVAAGHPNPDKPGDIYSLVNLKCGIIVGMGKPWTDKDGNQRQNTEVKTFFQPGAEAPAKLNGAAKRGPELNDAVPF